MGLTGAAVSLSRTGRVYDCRSPQRKMPMAASRYVRPTVSTPPPTNPLLTPTPPIAPLIPPVHVVDLMTEEGSAAFGAVWRGVEAELGGMPAPSPFPAGVRTALHCGPQSRIL